LGDAHAKNKLNGRKHRLADSPQRIHFSTPSNGSPSFAAARVLLSLSLYDSIFEH
jgi:hypothetical protein